VSADDDTLINAIKRKIPGYGAYREQEARRADDRMTRDFLVKRLSDILGQLDRLGAAAVAAGDLTAPLELEQLRKPIEHARARLSAAVEGFAGWFSERKVDAGLLAQVGTLDANLVSLVDQIDSFVQQLASGSLSSKGELREALELLQVRLDRRHELLKTGA
jgi:hypothetical protein